MVKMFVTVNEAMKILGRNESDILQFCREGRLRDFRDGKRIMLKGDQVDSLRQELIDEGSLVGLSSIGESLRQGSGLEDLTKDTFDRVIDEELNHMNNATKPSRPLPSPKPHNPEETPLHLPYEDEKASPYWDIVEKAIAELSGNQDLQVTTSNYYVIGYLVKQLEKADKK